MRRRSAAAALLGIAVTSLFAPALAASVACAEEGESGCCGIDCALCLCCSHAPQILLTAAVGCSGVSPRGSLDSELAAVPPEPFPRDVLHVPRSAAVR